MSADIRTNPNRHEHELMVDLMILRNTIGQHSEGVRKRLSCFPYAWRDLRLLWRLVSKLQDQLLQTMPPQREDYYRKLARNAVIRLDLEGPLRRDRYIMISEKRLGEITKRAMLGECALCCKEGRDVERCPLRDAFLEVAPPRVLSGGPHAMCEYRGIVDAIYEAEEG